MYQRLHCPKCDGQHWVYLCRACALVHDGDMCGSWEQRKGAWVDMVKDRMGPLGVPLFLTLTFGGRYPGPQRGRKALASFLEVVEGDFINAFFTEERGSENDRLHYHGLMMARPDMSLAQLGKMKAAWRQGFSRMEICEDFNGSLGYILKYVMKDVDFEKEVSWFEFRKGKYEWLSS